MPEMDKGMFAGAEQLQAVDWASLFTVSLERQHVEELLETHGWTGETNAIISVKLSQLSMTHPGWSVGQWTHQNPAAEDLAGGNGQSAPRSKPRGHVPVPVPRGRDGQPLNTG
jgi:hypothetical protein